MVGKLVGAAAFLSIIALLWVHLVRANFSWPASVGALVLFLIIGGFAMIEPGEWRKAPRSK